MRVWIIFIILITSIALNLAVSISPTHLIILPIGTLHYLVLQVVNHQFELVKFKFLLPENFLKLFRVLLKLLAIILNCFNLIINLVLKLLEHPPLI